MHELRPKVSPRLDLFGGRWGRENRGLAVRRQLAKRFFVTVIRLILRDEDKVWFDLQFLEMGYAWLCFLVGQREERVEDDGRANQPGIDQDREGSWEEAWGRQWGHRGTECEQERSVSVQGLYSQGHRNP